MRLMVLFGLWLLVLCAGGVSFAQLSQGIPPDIVSAGVTQEQWAQIQEEVRTESRRAGIAEAALRAAAERAGSNLARSGRFSAAALRDEIIGQLEGQAQSIFELQARLAVLARADDPEIARLLTAASRAIDLGQLDEADRFLEQAEESDMAAIAMAEARAERARARLADAIAERGRLETIQGGGEANGVRDAIAVYERTLAGLDRALAPNDWTRTQLNLGIAYAILAQSGDQEARVLAVAALEAARSGFKALNDVSGAARVNRLLAALSVR
jgi:hypothetical protein